MCSAHGNTSNPTDGDYMCLSSVKRVSPAIWINVCTNNNTANVTECAATIPHKRVQWGQINTMWVYDVVLLYYYYYWSNTSRIERFILYCSNMGMYGLWECVSLIATIFHAYVRVCVCQLRGVVWRYMKATVGHHHTCWIYSNNYIYIDLIISHWCGFWEYIVFFYWLLFIYIRSNHFSGFTHIIYKCM